MSRKIRVLVVDDDAVLRKLVSDQVGRMGFDSAPAASGEEALEALAKSDYDVVLLDIRMPGMSGLDALREIRKLEDPPEVIMLTADTSLPTGLEAMRLGAYDYLTKPSSAFESRLSKTCRTIASSVATSPTDASSRTSKVIPRSRPRCSKRRAVCSTSRLKSTDSRRARFCRERSSRPRVICLQRSACLTISSR